jgi:hypothetical protein
MKRHAAEAKEKGKPGGECKRPEEDVQAEGPIPEEQIRPDSESRSHSGDTERNPRVRFHWLQVPVIASSDRLRTEKHRPVA